MTTYFTQKTPNTWAIHSFRPLCASKPGGHKIWQRIGEITAHAESGSHDVTLLSGEKFTAPTLSTAQQRVLDINLTTPLALSA